MSTTTPSVQLTNSGSPLRIGDVEYTASVLTDRDYDDLSEWIRARYIQIGRSAGDLESDPVKRRAWVNEVICYAASIGWETHEGVNIISTFEGIIRLGWQMCRKRHPSLTIEQFTAQFKKDRDSINASIENIQEKYAYLNGTSTGESAGDQGGSSAVSNKSV